MDKTHNISLGGFAFQIDDAAYKVLKKYINDIRLSLHNSSGIDEIISDVEFRMAELLRQRMMAREVVNLSDVDYLISVMGTPADFYTDEFIGDEVGGESSTKSSYKHNYTRTKKLFRDPDDKMLGGVCSGLAHYFGIDTVWVRLAIILLPFLDVLFLGVSTGSVILFYFILWIVVPEANTTSEKLQMRGEPVNFDSIKDFFGNSPETVRNNINDIGDNARRVANSSGSVLSNLFRVLIKTIIIFIIGIMLVIALSILVAFVASIFGVGAAGVGVGVAYGSQFNYLFDNGWEKIVGLISLGFIMIIPAVGLILLAMRLISSRYRVPKFIGFSLPLLWLCGLIGLTIVATATITEFKQSEYEIKTVNIPTEASTILIERMGNNDDSYDLNELFDVKEGYLAIPIDKDLQVKKSTKDYAYMEFKYSSKGKTKSEANKFLEQIEFNYAVEDSIMRLDDYLYIKNGHKWRSQEVEPTLFLPENQLVQFMNFDDIESDEGGIYTWHSANSEKIFKFEDNILTCVNCPEKGSEENVENKKEATLDGVINIKNGNDSLKIKIKSNDTSHHNATNRNDSISD